MKDPLAASSTGPAYRRRRACLVVPASSPSKIARAASTLVDQVVLDLEDSVTERHKTDATRHAVADAIRNTNWQTASITVRVNATNTPWFGDDLRSIVIDAGPRLACVTVPKVESADEVRYVAGQLADLERATDRHVQIGIEAMIETALGLLRVDEIAAASPRLEALIFGAGDYAASMGLPLGDIGAIATDYPGDEWHYPRARIAVAAHAFGLEPIDGPYGRFTDLDGLAESAARARRAGFVGKWAIHPDQIQILQGAFSPSAAELERAERILTTLGSFDAAGRGVISVDGAMVDNANRRWARRVAALAAPQRRPEA
jgi:citrate lyase subunit beta/citryl-CoA lyase